MSPRCEIVDGIAISDEEQIPHSLERPIDSDLSLRLTAAAPRFVAALPDVRRSAPRRAHRELSAGDVIDDFQIVRVLGRGAGGTVYLATQQSLGRRIALKVSSHVGHGSATGREASTMASLEHPHIVQVYSESIDSDLGRRLLCMQYVPGPSLAAVLARLKQMPREELCGAAILQAIDEQYGDECSEFGRDSATLNAEGWRNREHLASLSYEAAVCWIGDQIAAALHFAHQNGVLHRDIKTANILIDAAGVPKLGDFGLAVKQTADAAAQPNIFGGTLAYMSPEHFGAFNGLGCFMERDVDERSDLYSLGVVLHEMLTYELPSAHWVSLLQEQVDFGSVAHSGVQLQPNNDHQPQCSTALSHTISRCLALNPSERHATAAELATELNGCQALDQWRRKLPDSRIARLVAAAPLAASVGLSILPHLLGSLFATAYIALVLLPGLSTTQSASLLSTAGLSIALSFPLIIAIAVKRYLPAAWVCQALDSRNDASRNDALRNSLSASAVEDARARLLMLPRRVSFLSLAGWLFPLLFIPLGLHFSQTQLTTLQWTHLYVCLALACLLATSYSFMVLDWLTTLYWYPRAWLSTSGFGERGASDLATARHRSQSFPLIAGCLPLAASIAAIVLGPELMASGNDTTFQLLMCALILLGMLGMPIATRLSAEIRRAGDSLNSVRVSGN